MVWLVKSPNETWKSWRFGWLVGNEEWETIEASDTWFWQKDWHETPVRWKWKPLWCHKREKLVVNSEKKRKGALDSWKKWAEIRWFQAILGEFWPTKCSEKWFEHFVPTGWKKNANQRKDVGKYVCSVWFSWTLFESLLHGQTSLRILGSFWTQPYGFCWP